MATNQDLKYFGNASQARWALALDSTTQTQVIPVEGYENLPFNLQPGQGTDIIRLKQLKYGTDPGTYKEWQVQLINTNTDPPVPQPQIPTLFLEMHGVDVFSGQAELYGVSYSHPNNQANIVLRRSTDIYAGRIVSEWFYQFSIQPDDYTFTVNPDNSIDVVISGFHIDYFRNNRNGYSGTKFARADKISSGNPTTDQGTVYYEGSIDQYIDYTVGINRRVAITPRTFHLNLGQTSQDIPVCYFLEDTPPIGTYDWRDELSHLYIALKCDWRTEPVPRGAKFRISYHPGKLGSQESLNRPVGVRQYGNGDDIRVLVPDVDQAVALGLDWRDYWTPHYNAYRVLDGFTIKKFYAPPHFGSGERLHLIGTGSVNPATDPQIGDTILL